MDLRHWIASLAVIAAASAPSLAQDDNNNHRRHRDEPSQSQESQQTEHGRREQSQAQPAPQSRERAVPRTTDSPREQTQRREDIQRRSDQVRRETAVPRAYPERGYSARPEYEVRRYDGGHYGEPLRYRYGYAPRLIRPTIIRVVPYRPCVYHPSWSIGIYYGTSGYYPYGYTPRGYYDPIPGRYYGGVRIVGAPRDARVFADGYYVGIADDFDGIFQHINLEAGPHHIEIQWGPYAPIAFDVFVRPGETITFRADTGVLGF